MAHTVRKALPNTLIPFVSPTVNAELLPKSRSLYETLSRLPNDGVGLRVYQTRWEKKGIAGCFWEVSRVQLKNKGVNGKAWGRLVWRGVFFCVSICVFHLCFTLGEKVVELRHYVFLFSLSDLVIKK